MENKMIKEHKIYIDNRGKIDISGVNAIYTFNDEQVSLSTVMGNLLIRGKDLKVNKLNVDSGDVSIVGQINSLSYTSKDEGKNENLLKKLFRWYDMVLDINIQFMYFFSNILCGIIIGFLFDTYRIIRGFKNPNKTLTAISDLLFWIFSALLTFIFMLLTNNVNIRYYTFIAFIIGLYLYFKLISKPFLGSLRFVIYYIMKSFRFLFRMILMFLRLIRVFYLNLGYYVRKFIGLVFIKQQENWNLRRIYYVVSLRGDAYEENREAFLFVFFNIFLVYIYKTTGYYV